MATAVLYVRSFWRWDSFIAQGGPIFSSVSSLKGAIYFGYSRDEQEMPHDFSVSLEPPQQVGSWSYYQQVAWSRWGFGGANFSNQPYTSYADFRFIAPDWSLLLLFSLLPAIRVVRLMRWKRTGICASCGYDLRATPDRCPECGAVPSEKSKIRNDSLPKLR